MATEKEDEVEGGDKGVEAVEVGAEEVCPIDQTKIIFVMGEVMISIVKGGLTEIGRMIKTRMIRLGIMMMSDIITMIPVIIRDLTSMMTMMAMIMNSRDSNERKQRRSLTSLAKKH